MAYPARAPQLSLDLGPLPDPATAPKPPTLELAGPHAAGVWVVGRPGQSSVAFNSRERADTLYQRLSALWRAQGYYEEVHGDLYDKRSGKRLRHGYRELFYQICDGHQLRATLRWLATQPRGRHYAFITEDDYALCQHCVLAHLREVTYAIRNDMGGCALFGWRVVSCEIHQWQTAEELCCEYCYAEIPSVECGL